MSRTYPDAARASRRILHVLIMLDLLLGILTLAMLNASLAGEPVMAALDAPRPA